MKSLKISLIALALLPVGVANAALVYDFEAATPGTSFAGGGVSGWTQSHADPLFEGTPQPLSGVLAGTGYFGSSNQVGYLGTMNANNPLSATTSLTGALPAATSVVNTQVSLSFGIADANNVAYPARDSFSVGITAAGSVDSLASIIFTPGTDGAIWDIGFVVNGLTTNTAFQLMENSDYSLYFNFLENSTQLMYGGFGLTPVVIGTVATTIDSSAELGNIVISHTQETLGTDVYSDNGAIFDNISTAVIPEPSTSLLAGLAALGLMRRRRSN